MTTARVTVPLRDHRTLQSRRPTTGLSPALRLSFTRLGHISCRLDQHTKLIASFNDKNHSMQACLKQSKFVLCAHARANRLEIKGYRLVREHYRRAAFPYSVGAGLAQHSPRTTGVHGAGSGTRFFQFKDALGHQPNRLAQPFSVYDYISASHITIGAVVQQAL